jgi:hypothetical protein
METIPKLTHIGRRIKGIARWQTWVVGIMIWMLEYFMYMVTYGKPGSFLWGQVDMGIVLILQQIPFIGLGAAGAIIGLVAFLDLITTIYVVKFIAWLGKFFVNAFLWFRREPWYVSLAVFTALVLVFIYFYEFYY